MSRNEDILRAMIDGTAYTKEPQSRNEELLLELKDVIEAGGLDPDNYYTKQQTDAKITEKVAEIVADAPEDFDTLKEMSDWIENHEESAAAMNSAIQGKVDKVTGKGLSTEDYTTAEKTKLEGIEAGANKTVVDSALNSSSTNPVQNKVIKESLDSKVDKVTGKGLSTNDFTDELLSKLGALTLKSVLQGQRNHIPAPYTYTMKMRDFGSAYNELGMYLIFFVTWSTTPSISIYAVAYSGGSPNNAAALKIAGADRTLTVSDGVISFSAPGLVRIIALS